MKSDKCDKQMLQAAEFSFKRAKHSQYTHKPRALWSMCLYAKHVLTEQ